jgi:hypothetical protein
MDPSGAVIGSGTLSGSVNFDTGGELTFSIPDLPVEPSFGIELGQTNVVKVSLAVAENDNVPDSRGGVFLEIEPNSTAEDPPIILCPAAGC